MKTFTNQFILYLFILSVSLTGTADAKQFQSVASGYWNVITTWQLSTDGGVTWSAAATFPQLANDTVIVKPGHIVTLYNSSPSFLGPASCKDLTIQTGGKIYAGPAAYQNFYVNIYGNITCNGTIGNGATFDYISFNVEGTTCLISGTGAFDASRIRKTVNVPYSTTTLTIAMNLNLRFASVSQTQLYNNVLGNAVFNITINTGVVVTLTGSAANKGNMAIDGVDGAAANDRGGTVIVNGSLIVSGSVYLTNNNNTNQCVWIVSSTGLLQCGQIVAPASGNAGNYLTVNNGGRLKITGTNAVTEQVEYPSGTFSQANGGFNLFSNTGNTYNFNSGSTVEYGAAGNQSIAGPVTYSNLTLSGSGSKIVNSSLTVNNNFTMQGSAILPALNYTLNVGGNWNTYNNTAFSANTGTVVFNGYNGTLQTITSGNYNLFYNLILNNSSNNIQLNIPVTVGNSLALTNGKLLLNSQTLTLNNTTPTSVSRTNGMIVSESVSNASKIKWFVNVAAAGYVFPFGLSNGNYIPFVFIPSGGTFTDVTVSTYGTGPDNLPWPTTPVMVTNLASSTGLLPDNQNATVDRYWQIDPTGSGVAILSFSYQASEQPSGYSASSMVSQRYNSPLNYWEPPLPSQASSPYTVSVNNVTQFGVWAISTTLSPLPLQWLDFNAVKNNNAALLRWTTAAEKDNDYFTVLRSIDGISFTDIGTVAASHNNVTINNYSFFDNAPFSGINYYRLKQTDLNGNSSFSKIVSLSFKNEDLSEGLTCNYSSDNQTLNIFPGKNDNGTDADLSVYSTDGRLVYHSQRIKFSDSSLHILLPRLPAGVYILHAVEPGMVHATKFIVQ